jgi:Domain of unknown function (DUF4394)
MKSIAASALALGLTALLAPATTAHAQTAYGVDATGTLFSFNVATPGITNTIGLLGFTPNAIDFRPATGTLYALDVDSSTGAGGVYTVNTTTGAATLVGSGFSSMALIGSGSIGMDFNPSVDRIRVVGENGANLRLNPITGALVTVDSPLSGVATGSTAVAYTNNVAPFTGTVIYYIDSVDNELLTSGSPNGGVTTTVGALGVDVGTDVGFDILTGASVNTGYVVDTTAASAANFYTVNLGSGALTFVGTIGRSFTGGFAIDQATAIPEPSTYAAVLGLVGLVCASARRRRA